MPLGSMMSNTLEAVDSSRLLSRHCASSSSIDADSSATIPGKNVSTTNSGNSDALRSRIGKRSLGRRTANCFSRASSSGGHKGGARQATAELEAANSASRDSSAHPSPLVRSPSRTAALPADDVVQDGSQRRPRLQPDRLEQSRDIGDAAPHVLEVLSVRPAVGKIVDFHAGSTREMICFGQLRTDTASSLPILNTRPTAAGVSISFTTHSTTSRTWAKHRTCPPSS